MTERLNFLNESRWEMIDAKENQAKRHQAWRRANKEREKDVQLLGKINKSFHSERVVKQ